MSDSRADPFTVLDWIGAVLAALSSLALLSFSVTSRSLVAMFEDFGGPLPLLTRLVISGWLPLGLGLVVAVIVLLGALRSAPLAQRRALVVAAFVLGSLGFGLCWIGVYLPIFELAGSIQAD